MRQQVICVTKQLCNDMSLILVTKKSFYNSISEILKTSINGKDTKDIKSDERGGTINHDIFRLIHYHLFLKSNSVLLLTKI